MTEFGKLLPEDVTIAGAWAGLRGAGERSRLIDGDRGFGADRAGPELDAGQMPFADRAYAGLTTEPVRDQPEVAFQGAVQVAVSAGEPGPRAGKRLAHLVLGHRQDAIDHRPGPRVAMDQGLLAGHEQPADRPRGVGQQPVMRPASMGRSVPVTVARR